jgi:hypothetical protein
MYAGRPPNVTRVLTTLGFCRRSMMSTGVFVLQDTSTPDPFS